ncbi:hypothetical protein ACI48J_04975 [Paenibacillus chitinolyticus]|uniref:hypothetical protein n=1 Tax=Paenibacillus chitinolyticus TaxID=79263 RepID=UPI00386AAB25
MDTLEHRRFLKSSTLQEYKIGGYIPDQIQLLNGKTKESLQWLKQTEFGGVIFVFSKHCTACNMDIALETFNKHQEIAYAMFCEGYSEEEFSELGDKHEGLKLYAHEMSCLEAELNIQVVPYMLVVNKIGQIIGGGIVNSYEHVFNLIKPLLRVIEERNG